jgi:hypothetical protein
MYPEDAGASGATIAAMTEGFIAHRGGPELSGEVWTPHVGPTLEEARRTRLLAREARAKPGWEASGRALSLPARLQEGSFVADSGNKKGP